MEILYYSAIQSVNRLQKSFSPKCIYTVCTVYLGFSLCMRTVGHFLFTFFFYSLRLSLRSLTKEKGKEEEGLTYGVLLDLVQTHLCRCFGKRKRQKSWYREIHPSYILKRIPRFFSLIHPQKKKQEEINDRALTISTWMLLHLFGPEFDREKKVTQEMEFLI